MQRMPQGTDEKQLAQTRLILALSPDMLDRLLWWAKLAGLPSNAGTLD